METPNLEAVLELQRAWAETGRTCDHGGPTIPLLMFIGDYAVCSRCGGEVKPQLSDVVGFHVPVAKAWAIVHWERLKHWARGLRKPRLIGDIVPWRRV